MTNLPESFSHDLTKERLQTVCENLMDVLDEAEQFGQSPNATAWVKGTANYGLPQGMLQQMHGDSNYPWLKLANQTMDYTARIGNTLVQFVVDDPQSPKKSHRIKPNDIERNQISLEFEFSSDEAPLTWRFYLNPKSNGVDYSPSITLIGYDTNGNIGCLWEYQDVISGPVSQIISDAVDIAEPILIRKKDKKSKNKNE